MRANRGLLGKHVSNHYDEAGISDSECLKVVKRILGTDPICQTLFKGWISKRIRGRGVEIILSFRKDHSYVSFSRGENRIERRKIAFTTTVAQRAMIRFCH